MPTPRSKTLREQLQELANSNLLETARKGFAAIDHGGERAKRKLREFGIAGTDEFVDSAGSALKRTAARLMTGREQP